MQYEDRFEAVEPLQSWKELWGCEQGMLDFLMCAVTNLFPIPSSFIAWDKEEDASCKRSARLMQPEQHLNWMSKSAAGGGMIRSSQTPQTDF